MSQECDSCELGTEEVGELKGYKVSVDGQETTIYVCGYCRKSYYETPPITQPSSSDF